MTTKQSGDEAMPPEGERVELPRVWPPHCMVKPDEFPIVEAYGKTCYPLSWKGLMKGEWERGWQEYISKSESDALISGAVAKARAEIAELKASLKEVTVDKSDCCPQCVIDSAIGTAAEEKISALEKRIEFLEQVEIRVKDKGLRERNERIAALESDCRLYAEEKVHLLKERDTLSAELDAARREVAGVWKQLEMAIQFVKETEQKKFAALEAQLTAEKERSGKLVEALEKIHKHTLPPPGHLYEGGYRSINIMAREALAAHEEGSSVAGKESE